MNIVPTNVTIWDWLFDSPSSSVRKNPSSALRGYRNGITGERINYAQVQEATTYLSTALVKRYGLKEGEAVALFSPNNIWYPVAVLGALRAGMLCGYPGRSCYMIDEKSQQQVGSYPELHRLTTSKK